MRLDLESVEEEASIAAAANVVAGIWYRGVDQECEGGDGDEMAMCGIEDLP